MTDGSGLHAVWGHEALKASLARSVRAGTLPATLLLYGARGAGKQRLALWLAQLVLCESTNDRGPCGSCRACRLALRVEHPDLHWYFPLPRPTGASSPEKLADALETARGEALAAFREKPLRYLHETEPQAIYLAAAQSLRRRALRRPSEGETQLFIIGDAESLVPQEASPEAANALLKLLEEPPPGSRFLLTSSEPGELLPTIRSRALPLHVPGLRREEVERFLVEVCRAERDQAVLAARLSHGCIGRALGFLPQEDGEPGALERIRRESLDLLEAALAPNPAEGFRRALEQRARAARALRELLDSLESWLRDLAATLVGGPDAVLNVDRSELLRSFASRLTRDPAASSRALAALDESRLLARGNVNPQLLIAGLVSALRGALLAEPAGVGS
jgi:DNA polymerase-3 subunit delta'